MEPNFTTLRQLRRERAWSIRELAKRSGVSTETIYSLEHGRREWAWPRTIRRLAWALEVEPRELMKGD
jgi:transcriptional regulator with XRE-family HTH domain